MQTKVKNALPVWRLWQSGAMAAESLSKARELIFCKVSSAYLQEAPSGKRFVCCLLGWTPSILHGQSGPEQNHRTITATLEPQSRWFRVFKATSHKDAGVLNIVVTKNSKYGTDVLTDTNPRQNETIL